jgi:hypothetical protein
MSFTTRLSANWHITIKATKASSKGFRTTVIISYIYAEDGRIVGLSGLGGLLNLILPVGIGVFRPVFIIPCASLRCSHLWSLLASAYCNSLQ